MFGPPFAALLACRGVARLDAGVGFDEWVYARAVGQGGGEVEIVFFLLARANALGGSNSTASNLQR